MGWKGRVQGKFRILVSKASRPLVAFLLEKESGAAALEFGLVALPFLALLGALVQTAFTMWASQNLDFTLQKVARPIFTGAFQTANSGQTDSAALLGLLKTSMCGSSTAPKSTVFDCNNVKIDVSSGASFSTLAPATPLNASTKDWNTSFGTNYYCAPPNSIVIVSVAVKFPVFFSLLSPGIVSFADGSHLLQSTTVFRTEPYGTPGSTPC